MKCVDAKETGSFIETAGFSLQLIRSTNDQILESNYESKNGNFVEANVKLGAADIANFALTLSNLLPLRADRMIWIERLSFFQPSVEIIVNSLREYSGERRPLEEARGHHFPATLFSTYDFSEMTEQQQSGFELFISLMCTIMVGGWDAKLITASPDSYISFWEGNVLFYSVECDLVAAASKLFANFDLPRTL